MPLNPAARSPQWLDTAGFYGALLLPLAVTLWHVDRQPLWSDDRLLSQVFGQGLPGFENALSSAWAAAAAWLPLGARPFRAAVCGALAVAWASSEVYRLARWLLKQIGLSPLFGTAFAFVAALQVAFAPLWQWEGSHLSGAALGTALALAWLRWLFTQTGPAHLPTRFTPFFSGAFWGLIVAESHLTGAISLLGWLLLGLYRRQLPSLGQLALTGLGAALGWGSFALPALYALYQSGGLTRLQQTLAQSSLVSNPYTFADLQQLQAFLPGPILLALTSAGLVFGLYARHSRALSALLFVWALPLGLRSLGRPEPKLELLALSACYLLCAGGIGAFCTLVQSSKIPQRSAVVAMALALDLSFALVELDGASFLLEQTSAGTSTRFTDEALHSLPPRSLVLSYSPQITDRLRTARALSGARPDVLILSAYELERHERQSALMSEEPAIAAMLRELSLTGAPSEYALSTLADARPLFLDYQEDFDRRLIEHLAPSAFWMQFAAQPLGRSDRQRAQSRAEQPLNRLLRKTDKQPNRSEPTRAVMREHLLKTADFSTRLADRQGLLWATDFLRRIDGNDVAARELEQGFERPRGKRVATLK